MESKTFPYWLDNYNIKVIEIAKDQFHEYVNKIEKWYYIIGGDDVNSYKFWIPKTILIDIVKNV